MGIAMEQIIYQLVILIGSMAIFYFIIKMAVKNGMIEAHKKIDEQNAKKEKIGSE